MNLKNTKWGIIPIVMLLALGSASYADIAPKKASSLVTLDTTIGCGPITSVPQFTNRIMPDGNSVAFAVPENQVLIVTDVDWTTTSGFGTEPRTEQAKLFLLNEAMTNTETIGISVATGITNWVGGSFHFEHGIPVKPGVAICILLDSTNTVFGILRGYLAPDK